MRHDLQFRVNMKGVFVPRRIELGFLLLPSFTLTPFSALLDLIRLAADVGDRSKPQQLRWTLLSTSLEPVTASCGARIAPWETLGDPGRFDYLVVCGGLLSRDRRSDQLVQQFLQDAARQNVSIISLCTGVFDLAEAGLLDGRKACVSWFHAAQFTERYDCCEVIASQLYVEDGPIITCSGGTGAADVGALIVQRHLGLGASRKALDILLIDQPRGPTYPQPASMAEPIDDHLVRRALLAVEHDPAGRLSVASLSAHLGASKRTIERRFLKATGLSPQRFLLRARLQRAGWLLQTSDLSLTTIAANCGFADSAHFSREFRKAFRCTPSMARTQRGGHILGEFRPYPMMRDATETPMHSVQAPPNES
jgi:transcriptional regulator GlxA family with amidase domain